MGVRDGKGVLVAGFRGCRRSTALPASNCDREPTSPWRPQATGPLAWRGYEAGRALPAHGVPVHGVVNPCAEFLHPSGARHDALAGYRSPVCGHGVYLEAS